VSQSKNAFLFVLWSLVGCDGVADPGADDPDVAVAADAASDLGSDGLGDGPPHDLAVELDSAPEPPSAPDSGSDVSTTDVGSSDAGGFSEGGAPPVVGAALPRFLITADPAGLAEVDRDRGEDIELAVRVEHEGRVWPEVTLQLHGGYARRVPKKSYRLTFPDDDELPVGFFPEREPERYRRLVFLASWIDPTFMRNKLTMDLVRALGGLAPHNHWAVLWINGVEHGLYVVSERIDRQYLRREGLDREGNGYKAFSHAANWRAKEDPLAGFEHKINPENPTDDLGRLLEVVTHTPTTHADFRREVEPWLSLGDFKSWSVVHTLAMNADTFTKNYYLYHDVDAALCTPQHPFRIISWDADATWGMNWDGQWREERDPRWHGWDRFSPRLMDVPEHRRSYLGRYRRALAGPLSAAAIHQRLDRMLGQIEDQARVDLQRWRPDLDLPAEVARLRDFVTTRVEEMSRVVEAEADR